MNAWTGGQYSVYRVGLGVYAAAHAASVDSVLAVILALGFLDRIAALLLAAGLVFVADLAGVDLGARRAIVAVLLVLHACTQGRPYGSLAARARPDPGGGWRMPRWHPFHWLGPGMIPPRRDASPATLYYDGGCGLCHRAVRFVLAEDPDGGAFRFAPLASESFANALSAAERAALPDSLVVRIPDGRVFVRTAAVREICNRLGGLWRLLALASRIVPERWLDHLYDRVARARKRLFAPPAEACPLVPADLRARFD